MNVGDIVAHFKIEVDGDGSKKIRDDLKTITEGMRALGAEAKANLAIQKLGIAETKESERQAKNRLKEEERVQKESSRIAKEQTREQDRIRRENERAEKKSLEERRKSYQEFFRSVRNLALGIAGVVALAKPTMEKSLDYRDFARQTGLSIEELQKYQSAAFVTGSRLSAQQVTQEITGLQQRLVNVEFGQGDLFPFKMLGISAATRDAMEVLEALRNSIQNLPDPESLNLIKRMGLSADWLHILRQSREEFEKTQRAMLSRNQVKTTTDLALSFRQLTFALANLRDQIVAFLGGALSNFLRNIKEMANDVSIFLKELYNSPTAFRAFAAGVAIVMTAISPLTAALAGLYLLINDFYVWTKGGVSLIDWDFLTGGDWNDFKNSLSESLEYLGGMSEIIKGIVNILQGAALIILESFRGVYAIGENIGKTIAGIEMIVDVVSDKIDELINSVGRFLTKIFGWLGYGKGNEFKEAINEGRVSLFPKVPLDNLPDWVKNNLVSKEIDTAISVRNLLENIGFNPDTFLSRPAVSSQYAPINNITVNVNTPEEGSRFTNDYINKQSQMNTTFVDMASVGGY